MRRVLCLVLCGFLIALAGAAYAIDTTIDPNSGLYRSGNHGNYPYGDSQPDDRAGDSRRDYDSYGGRSNNSDDSQNSGNGYGNGGLQNRTPGMYGGQGNNRNN